MANKEIDLSKLKNEIHTRKQAKNEAVDDNGSNVKDKFLNNLVESLNTGRPSEATNKIRKVDEVAAEKSGDKPQSNTSNNSVSSEVAKYKGQQNVNQNNQPVINNENDRDEKLYEELERRKKEMLGGGALKYNQTKSSQTQETNQPSSGNIINEEKIYETVNNVITEKFATVVDQAMKDSIVEIYAEARMKEVLEENKNIIRKIVIDTIKELQSKKKK
jgi:hypothetical protein